MRKGRVLAAVVLLGAIVGGCTNPKYQTWPYVHRCTETLGETPEEHCQRTEKVGVRDAQNLAEDWDVFMMTDRPSRLNRWHDK